MWDNLKQIAPTGVVFIDGARVPAEMLIYCGYENLSITETFNARNMITKEIEHLIDKFGNLTTNTIYNVYNDKNISATHCLNVYGARMVRDHLNKVIENSGDDNNEVGFNYTGIQ